MVQLQQCNKFVQMGGPSLQTIVWLLTLTYQSFFYLQCVKEKIPWNSASNHTFLNHNDSAKGHSNKVINATSNQIGTVVTKRVLKNTCVSVAKWMKKSVWKKEAVKCQIVWSWSEIGFFIQFLTKFLMIFQLGVHRRIFTSRVAHYIFSTKVEDNKIKIWPKHVQKNDEIY